MTFFANPRHALAVIAVLVAGAMACRANQPTSECTPTCTSTEFCCLGRCLSLGGICGDSSADASVAPPDLRPADPCAPKNGALTASACRDEVTLVACLSSAIGNTFDCSAYGAVCYEQRGTSPDGPYTHSGCAPPGRAVCDPLPTRSTECRDAEIWDCTAELSGLLPPSPPRGLFPSSVTTWHLTTKCKDELARADATCTVVDYPHDVPPRSAAVCVAP